jgi:hypothetical protein
MTTLDRIFSDEKLRVRLGIQCPECFGVRTDKPANASQFQCLECGCQWDRNYYETSN